MVGGLEALTMTLWWWRCEWCLTTTPSRHSPAEAEADRNLHIETEHRQVVAWGAALLTLRTYPFLEVHQ